MPDISPAVSLEQVSQAFGALRAVDNVSLRILEGERRAILGPNGAGKTTLFNLICGDHRPTTGRVILFGRDVTALRTHQRARLGVGRTYQNSRLFNGLTVLDNLHIAVRGKQRGRFSIRRPSSNDEHMATARDCAVKVRLDRKLQCLVAELSHGDRRLLELGMALASHPRVLMLDEPAAGLSPTERPELLNLLQQLPRDLTLILIEHDMDIALSIADMVTVMKDGVVVAEAEPRQIGNDPAVQGIYLGGAH